MVKTLMTRQKTSHTVISLLLPFWRGSGIQNYYLEISRKVH